MCVCVYIYIYVKDINCILIFKHICTYIDLSIIVYTIKENL